MKRKDPYRWLTPIYSFLVRLVYGNHLRKAEAFCCQFLLPQQKILIIGGGDGDILPLLPAGTQVDYVDFSPSMLQKASHKVPENVKFYPQCADVLEYEPQIQQYDAVLFPYLLDLFSPEEVGMILLKAKAALKPEGWLGIADFQQDKWWHKGLLKLMYGFFGILVNLKTRRLSPYIKISRKIGFEIQEEASFYGGFVRGYIFRVI